MSSSRIIDACKGFGNTKAWLVSYMSVRRWHSKSIKRSVRDRKSDRRGRHLQKLRGTFSAVSTPFLHAKTLDKIYQAWIIRPFCSSSNAKFRPKLVKRYCISIFTLPLKNQDIAVFCDARMESFFSPRALLISVDESTKLHRFFILVSHFYQHIMPPFAEICSEYWRFENIFTCKHRCRYSRKQTNLWQKCIHCVLLNLALLATLKRNVVNILKASDRDGVMQSPDDLRARLVARVHDTMLTSRDEAVQPSTPTENGQTLYTGLFLRCIEADFCNLTFVGKLSPRSTQCTPLHNSAIAIVFVKNCQNVR